MYSGYDIRFVLALHLLYNSCYVTNVAQKYCYFPIWQNKVQDFVKLQCGSGKSSDRTAGRKTGNGYVV